MESNQLVDLAERISREKEEPEWMAKIRRRAALAITKAPREMPLPLEVDLEKIAYYIHHPVNAKTWDEVPKEIREEMEKLGIPEAERKYLAGLSLQYDSDVIYKSFKEKLAEKGIVFSTLEEALKKHEGLVRAYFGRLVSHNEHILAALNTAFWSGGTFIYVPKGVVVDRPLQSFFRMSEAAGQFERSIIIAEEGAKLEYIEGCTAPLYRKFSLHTPVVEVFVGKNARLKFITSQNWSRSIVNAGFKRASVYENGYMEWVDANFGAKQVMKYPTTFLNGEGAKVRVYSLSYARGQIIDSGAKVFHNAASTTSHIISKSISTKGVATYRGTIHISKEAVNSKASVSCDSFLAGGEANTYPNMVIDNESSKASHEAKITKFDEEQIFYLQSRGLDRAKAQSLILGGFISEFKKLIPLPYLAEINKLIEMDMEGSVG